MATYTEIFTFNAGRTRSGLSTVRYTFDGGTTWQTSGITESLAGSGIYQVTLVLSTTFSGTMIWDTGDSSESVTSRQASEAVNPPPPIGTVALDTSTPIPIRNQDDVTAPTVGDALLGGWTAAFAKESTNAAAMTYTKKLPDDSGPVRTHDLSIDVNGNVNARS